jgi:hypothetical protein
MFWLVHSHHMADYKDKTEKFTVSWFNVSKLTSTAHCYTKFTTQICSLRNIIYEIYKTLNLCKV